MIPSGGSTVATPDADDLLGRTLAGRYRLARLIGRGGHGVVFEARDTLLDRDVAVKVLALRPERGDDEARFLREARAAARVEHPGVVRVLDLGRDEAAGCVFLAQELVRGATLRDWMEEQLVATPAQAMALLGPVMEGLAAAHARGVVHRDVKPENVLLAEGPDGSVTPRVIDFGVASLAGRDEPATPGGRISGTPAYMAPELARGEREPDARADVWAVGVMLYELLLGRRPYDADGTRALVAALAHAEPVRFARRAPEASAALCEVVERALAPAPDDRYPTLDAMRAALARCDEVNAPDAPWTPRTLAASTRTSREIAPLALASRPPPRAARWAAGALLAAAVAAVVVAVGLHGRPAPRATAVRVATTAPAPQAEAPAQAVVVTVPAAVTDAGAAVARRVEADVRPARLPRREPARPTVVGVNQAPILAPPGLE